MNTNTEGAPTRSVVTFDIERIGDYGRSITFHTTTFVGDEVVEDLHTVLDDALSGFAVEAIAVIAAHDNGPEVGADTNDTPDTLGVRDSANA